MSNGELSLAVKVRMLKTQTKSALAFASVTVGGVLALNDIVIRNGTKGIFVSLPSRKDEKATDKKYMYRDIFHPVTADFRVRLNTVILEAFEKAKLGEL